MATSSRVVLLSGPEIDTEAVMRFRLTYSGELRPSGREPDAQQPDPLALHKHKLRQAFHVQLKQLWATNKFLREHELDPRAIRAARPVGDDRTYWSSGGRRAPMSEIVADQYKEFGYRFLPLVREDISLLCSLKILFLRRDIPGSVISAGDIDNRIKTIIDGLRRPRNGKEVLGNEVPKEGEDPFFVLLEDDKLVTHLEVETDTLLDPPTGGNFDHRLVHLVITVELRPYNVTLFNLSFS